MNKVLKVPLKKYIFTFAVIAVHIIVLALLAAYFLPEFRIKAIVVIGAGFFVFKIISYLVVSLGIKDDAIIINGLFKRGIFVPLRAIQEVEIMAPTQFNSNYTLAFFGDGRKELGRLPIYWYSRHDMEQMLEMIQAKNHKVIYHPQLNQYLARAHWKRLMVNYVIQYILLTGIAIFIIMKNK